MYKLQNFEIGIFSENLNIPFYLLNIKSYSFFFSKLIITDKTHEVFQLLKLNFNLGSCFDFEQFQSLL